MVAKLLGSALGILLLATTAAPASEATTVADRAGFLIGHAQRCGVAEARVESSAKRMDAVVAAFAADDTDRDAAQAQFVKSMAVAALAQLLGDKLPSCGVVRSMLAQFERHRDAAEHRARQLAGGDRRDGGTARHAANADTMRHGAAKRTATKSAERRAALELRRAAQQTRG